MVLAVACRQTELPTASNNVRGNGARGDNALYLI